MAAVYIATCHLTAGMQHVATNESGVTVLKFGKQSSALLAYGCQDGSVHVLNLEEAGDADHVSNACAARPVLPSSLQSGSQYNGAGL